MLDSVKLALRISSDALDNEITSLIEACEADLRLSGVLRITPDDPLIQRAIILYAKAHFGFSDDNEKYQRSYNMLKCSLCLAGEYNASE